MGTAFKDRIRELRRRDFPSQEAFAYRAGVSRATVQNWETGKHAPRLDEAIRLAELFSVSLDYLAGVTSEAEPESEPAPSRTRRGRRSRTETAAAAMADVLEGASDMPPPPVPVERRRGSRRAGDQPPP